jgi:iron complex outermembrane recepter protein
MEKGGQHWTLPKIVTGIPAAAALVFVGGTSSQPANAQEAQSEPASSPTQTAPTETEEIVVVGYRQALNAALEEKREAIGSIDAIVAEDIADFPDLNLAESIQRIPGVSIDRNAGEGRRLTVRGLGSQFTRVRINGIEALTTTGGEDAAGGTNRDRSFDFNVFASELFNNITVRKTASADIEEGSLGATVDLNVARPFDYDGFTFVTGAQGAFNDLADEVNPRGAFLVSNTWADGKFGALLSAAYTKRDLLDNGTRTVRYQNDGSIRDANGNITTAGSAANQFQGLDPTYTGTASISDINQAFHPRIPAYEGFQTEQERVGVTTSFQFKPGERTLLTLDGLYAKFDTIRQETQLESQVFSDGGATGIRNTDVVNATVVDNGVNGLGQRTSTLVAGTFNDVDIRSEGRYDDLSTQFTQVNLNGDHSFTDTLKMHASFGRSKSEHDNPISTTLIMDAQDVDGYSFDFTGDSRLPSVSYGNADVTNPGTWALTQIRINSAQVDNTIDNYMGDLEWQFSDGMSAKFGVQYKEYENVSVTTNRVAANGGTGNQQTIIPAGIPTAVGSYSRLFTLDGVDVPAGTPRTWLVPDVQQAYSVLGLGNQAVFPTGITSVLGNNFTVNEDDAAGFLQFNFQTELAGLPVRGNLGVRYVQTDQSSTGFSFGSGQPVLVTIDRDFSDTLPSLNVATNVTEDLIVRFSAAKTVSRNSLINLNPGATATISGANKVLAAGNPFLDPQRAKVYDLGFEWYYQPEALLGVAVFYKDINSFVQTIRSSGDFGTNPLGIPNSVAFQACGPAVDQASCLANWQFALPANTPGGNLKGAELSFQQPFTFLPAPYNNFGAIVNYTFVDSEIQYLTANAAGQTIPAATQDLIGLSKNAANATLYYDNGTFGARVSAAYRDDFFTTVPGRNGNDFEGTVSTTTVDLSSSYKLTDSLTFTFEALNITDEYNDQFVDTVGNRLSFYHHTGREYLMGARYRF